jgi:hypothetical protein
VPSPSPVIPYGGDTAVARSMLAVHVRERWTGVCRGCRDRYPCRERLDSQRVLGVTASRPSCWLGWLSVPVLTGMLLLAVATTGLVLW